MILIFLSARGIPHPHAIRVELCTHAQLCLMFILVFSDLAIDHRVVAIPGHDVTITLHQGGRCDRG
jgi:hypothetical protein